MIKRMSVIAFALGTPSLPTDAASLSPFAQDAAGRPVLEFDPAADCASWLRRRSPRW
jgi:hypothetical protein